MRVLVWQWGRRGAGPRVAVTLAQYLAEIPGMTVLLSLSTGAELLQTSTPPVPDLPFATYGGLPGLLRRVAMAPLLIPRLERWLREQRIDVALCAMPAALDWMMSAALGRAQIPFAVVVHDAMPHPGDMFPSQLRLQRRLLRQAGGAFTLSQHVADSLITDGTRVFRSSHPPFAFGTPPAPPGAHGGPLRLLSFGRLLAYKGLDLLAGGLAAVGPRPDLVVRIVGQGPDTPELAALSRLPNVTVENRWVPEDELGALLAWSDAVVLSYREASQSGVAAAALAARRWVIATDVGGLREQLQDEPSAQLCAPTAAGIADAIRQLLDRQVPDRQVASPGPAPAWTAEAKQMAADLRVVQAGVSARA